MLRPFRSLSALIALVALPGITPAADVAVAGRVLGPGGLPFPEAEVTLLPVDDPMTGFVAVHGSDEAKPVAEAITDPEGTCVLAAPSAGHWNLRVVAPGFVPMQAGLRPLIEPTDLPDLELTPDAGLTVRATDPDGTSVEGAWVQLAGAS